jgi:hypothetical protein
VPQVRVPPLRQPAAPPATSPAGGGGDGRIAPFLSSRNLHQQISGTLRREEGGPHLPRLRRGSLLSRRERGATRSTDKSLSRLRERRGPLRQQWEVRVFPPAQTSGLARTIRGSHRRPQQSHGAAGAVALRLELNKATEWSVTARRAGQGFRRDTLMGPMVPGLRYRRRANGASVLFTREVHPGMSPGLPDEAGSLPAFAGSPWPDLPRAVRDRTPPARPILSLHSRPERYLIRLPEGQITIIA